MKILQLCHRVPFPANDGGNIAMLSMADSLRSQGAEIKMLALNTLKHHVEISNMDQGTVSKYNLEAVPVDTTIKISDAFLNIFSSESYNIQRFYSPDFEKKLVDVLGMQKPDVVLMESLFMTPYIPAIRKCSDAKIVLRAHNVEYVIWERLTLNEKNLAKKIYLGMLTRRLRKYETKTINQVDALLPITPDDQSFFNSMGCRVPMFVAPVGIDTDAYNGMPEIKNELCLFHLGAMDWRPNLEGIDWFLDKCWEPIHTRFPDLMLYLAGRGFPDRLMKKSGDSIKCFGEITDAIQFMNGKQILIVPLKSGGGMRVKIIQGMAMGKTIISTTIGAEGIAATNGKNILIGDAPEEILAQVEKCMLDKSFCYQIGNEARKLVMENYSNQTIGRKLMIFLKGI